ncbi:hypothetical protein BG418_07005 [Streptomyces sp. CBMA152]|nr:hypothetical protein [Streptomyces sp. CBMA152]
MVATTVLALGGPLALSTPAVSAAATPAHDHVLEWNQVLRQQFTKVCGEYSAPGPLVRAGAMMHAAIWDADNSISGGSDPAYGFYLGRISADAGASAEAAIDQAAHDTLVAAFPGQQASFYDDINTALNRELSYLPASVTDAQKTAGQKVGQQAAQAMIAARAADTNTAFGGTYTVDQTDGRWRPTEGKPAVGPNWGKLKPFAMTTGDQFRPPLPAGYSSYSTLLASPEYAAQVNEVQRVGSATATTADRSDDQTQYAKFWANDLGPICDGNNVVTPGTYKPPGQLFETTAAISQSSGEQLGEFANARLFALVAISMADASITAWDAKYDTPISLWRPVTAIRNANTATNSALQQDRSWNPLSAMPDGTHFTPPFPSYVSGHATFAGAWAGVMRDYFGDNVSYTAHTQDKQLTNPETVTRSFNSISAAATEDGFSRLYLGVHYRFDTEQGLSAGYSVGDYAYRNALQRNGAIAYQGPVASAAAAASGTSLALPVGRTVRAGDTLLVSAMLTNTHSGAVGATDTQGNVYSVVTDKADGASDRTLVLASIGVKPLTPSDTITLTYPTTGEHHASVEEFSGVTAVDRTSSATGAAGTPFNSGSTATTNAANELVFGVAGVQGGDNATWDAGFTARPTLFVSEDQLATAYQIVPTTGSYAASGTATHQWMASVVTLR